MSSSGASTPRGAMTPPPGDGPSPLTVGTRFVKQYYKVLSTTPNQIHRFYQPTSFLSHGQGSQPTQPQLFERIQQQQIEQDATAVAARTESSTATTTSDAEHSHELLRQRFVLKGFEDCVIRFEFEHGAIDAQVSVNGGVLLVVTGHVSYLGAVEEEAEEPEDSVEQRRKAFVHTFFLGSISAGTKRSYYVHNDILRFLEEDPVAVAKVAAAATAVVPSNVPATVDETATATTTASSTAGKSSDAGPVAPVKVVPDVHASTTNGGSKASAVVEKVEVEVLPGKGVEETKESVPEVAAFDSEPSKEVSTLATPVKTKAVADSSPGGGVEETKDDMPVDPPRKTGTLEGAEKLMSKPKPSAGSWASLVASSGPSAASTPTPGTPARRTTANAKSKPSPVAAVAAAATNTNIAASNASAPPVSPPKKATPVPKASSTTTTTPVETAKPAESGGTGNRAANRSNKRDPDCTLVIKNIDSATTEPDVIALFETFSIQTETKIVGITVSANRGIAFVDYDAAAPVLMAVEEHTKEPMQIRGRVLEIYQKTLEQRARRGGGGGGGNSGGRGVYRGGGGQSGSGGDGGRGGGGGGRQQFRRGTGGRGDRGSGRGDGGTAGGRGEGGTAGRGGRAGR